MTAHLYDVRRDQQLADRAGQLDGSPFLVFELGCEIVPFATHNSRIFVLLLLCLVLAVCRKGQFHMRSPLLLRTLPTFQFDTWHTFTDVRPSQMMDNELAKELKEAGFPQAIHYNSGGVADYLETDANGKTHIVSVPTLEELLETCGAAFQSVGRVSYAPFLARGQILQAAGQTPIEAVARLWLALQAAKPK